MKQLLFTISVFYFGVLFGQQDPQYSNYQMNNFMLNPAVAGSYAYQNVKMGVRYQWVGIEGSPRTVFATYQAPIHHPDLIPKTTNKIAHHGVGVTLFQDETGPISYSGLSGTYAFHAKISETFTLSLGASSGFKSFALDENKLEFVHTKDDSKIGNNLLRKMVPDLNMGTWLYSKRMFFGISGRQLFKNNLSFSKNSTSNNGQQMTRHYFITTGYLFDISEQWHLIPSVMLQYNNPAPLQMDINGTLWYQKQFAFGFSYRHRDALYMILDFAIKESLEIGYAFDFTLSELTHFNTGSHEIIVGYKWNPQRLSCPAQFW